MTSSKWIYAVTILHKLVVETRSFRGAIASVSNLPVTLPMLPLPVIYR